MWTAIKTLLILAVLSAIGWAAYAYGKDVVFLKSELVYNEVELTRGSLTTIVRSSGEVKPAVTISVGSGVSGPVQEVLVDFNEKVEKGQLLARIDSRTYAAAAARDQAVLATTQADLKRAEVLVAQAKADEDRTLALQKENAAFVSVAELDLKKFNRMSMEAQREVALAAVQQAEATMQNSKANLEYTEIRAPVAGVVIDRKIEPGQTLASQFTIPELFRIAQDMDREMRIIVAVDEADIGTIVAASEAKRPIRFSVDAYPDEFFQGQVSQIRKSADARQAVVTYPVVISVPNPDPRLLPGMTASVEFEVSETKDALLIPNAALRVLPDPKSVVPDQRAAYRALTDVKNRSKQRGGAAGGDAKKAANKRMVWVNEGKFLRYVEITIGENNDQHTEILEGPLKAGDRVVSGITSE